MLYQQSREKYYALIVNFFYCILKYILPRKYFQIKIFLSKVFRAF